MPYLVPVADPYCTSQPNARWSKTVSLDEWITYLIKNGFKPDPDVATDFSFQQTHRIPDYTVNDLILPVKQLRADWQLRSAFFSVSADREQVVLNGKGYGHGVGLCQEGAMEMGRRGFKYDEIISFYYKYVNLVPVTSLKIEVPEFELR
jgi:stage II sporulation protein D